MIAIDTNIWIYCHDTRDLNKQAIARHVVEETQSLVLPWQVGCEFIAATKKLFQLGFEEERAWECLSAMRDMADLVALPSVNQWNLARNIKLRHKFSFWDAMLLACCIENSVNKLITEDLNSGSVIEGVAIINPF